MSREVKAAKFGSEKRPNRRPSIMPCRINRKSALGVV